MSPDKESSVIEKVGGQRFLADKRQFAGLLFGLSIAVMIQPLGDVASLIGPNGTTVKSGTPFAVLFGALAEIFLGLVGTIVGYLQLVHDYGNLYLTGFAACTCQLAFIAYIGGMTSVGQATRTGAAFIPADLNPSVGDARFLGAMGILSIVAYGFSSVGSVAFMEFSLFAYQNGKQGDRGGRYFFGRMSFYTMMLTLAGLTQLLVGCYIRSQFGSGPLADTIRVAVYVINFPEISIFVGLVQLLNGLWGMGRSLFGMAHWGPNDVSYPISMAFQWICTLVLQVMTQVSYTPGGALATTAPAIACLAVGFHVMPAFLDYKMRNLPQVIPEDFYGPNPAKVERESMQVLRESIAVASWNGAVKMTEEISTTERNDEAA